MVQAFAWHKGIGCLHWGRIGAAVTFRAVFAGEGGERKARQGMARHGKARHGKAWQGKAERLFVLLELFSVRK